MSDLMVDGVDIRLLNDEILFEKLVEVGYTPGPIVDSTRSVYQRKLAKILRNEDDDDDNDDGSDEDDRGVATKSYYSPYQSPTSGTFTTPTSPYSFDDLRRRPLPRSSLGYESSPMTSYTRSASPSRLTSEPAKSPSIPIKVKLAIVFVVALFALVVYQNMESVTTNPVPEE